MNRWKRLFVKKKNGRELEYFPTKKKRDHFEGKTIRRSSSDSWCLGEAANLTVESQEKKKPGKLPNYTADGRNLSNWLI